MKVFIFGASGMLGKYLNVYLSSYFEVVPITRNEVNLNFDFSLITEKYTFNSSDVIINAAGIIKQRNYSPKELIRVNSLFPHFLSTLGCNVINITTDCVFSGKDGSYNEESPHDCLDDYGKSKSLGECEDLTVIRTSIIGEELLNKKSLIEWVKSNQNTTINGYLNHFWNGVTCLELSKHILNIIQNNSYWEGIRHYFSPDTVNKYQLVSYINEIYELNNNVNPVMSYYCDRSLSTKYESPVSLSIKEQILELKQFELNSSSKETKLKNFPSFNLVSIVESEERRKRLYDNLEKYGIKNVRPHIYERYKNGDHNIHIDPTIEFTFNDSYLGAFTSHLKAIREWYENTDEPYTFFCEDDISFETIQYWNFTWEEFFNKLPSDWDCVQLSLTRENETMFFYFKDTEVHLRNRWLSDSSCLAYLISRKHAKNLLDTYYDGKSFIFEYRGPDRESRMNCYGYFYAPTIENIIYSCFDNTHIYAFPLFVEDIQLETTVWQNGTHKDLQEYSYSSIIEWWKTKGNNMTINDFRYKN